MIEPSPAFLAKVDAARRRAPTPAMLARAAAISKALPKNLPPGTLIGPPGYSVAHLCQIRAEGELLIRAAGLSVAKPIA